MSMNKTFEVSNRYHDYKDYTREYTEVGRSIPRLDGPLKVTGKLQYTGDLSLPRMAWAKILRSPHAHAKIKNIDYSKALELDGGFGGKGVATMGDFITSKFSSRVGRPVKCVYERSEVFAQGQGHHPCFMKFRQGFDKDGHITAVDFQNLMVAGAYMSWGVVVLFYTASMTHLPYVTPAAKFSGKLIYTNTQTCGAHRGLGGSQPRFAMEILMDMAADKLGLNPLQIRLINAVESGHTCRSMMYVPHCEYKKALATAAANCGFEEKVRNLPFGKGIGISGGYYISGTSYTLYLSYKPHTVAMVKIEGENNVVLYCGATDIGQGADMAMAQMAAETLGVRAEDVKVQSRDTENTTFELGTFASRVTYATGWAIRRACEAANQKLFPVAAAIMGCRGQEVGVKDYQFYSLYERKRKNVDWNEVVDQYIQANGPLVTTGQFTPPRRKGIQQGGNIGHSPTFGFTCQIAEVTVDLYTGNVHVDRITEAGDLGQPINPMSCEGQVHGSIQMGMGHALLEEMRYADDGRLLNPSFHDYKLVGTMDIPEIDATIVESYDPSAPYGAKESGEGPVQPTPSAIFNAVYDAIGFRCTEQPLTQEKVLNYLKSIGKNL